MLFCQCFSLCCLLKLLTIGDYVQKTQAEFKREYELGLYLSFDVNDQSDLVICIDLITSFFVCRIDVACVSKEVINAGSLCLTNRQPSNLLISGS
ncbi:protein of unknown function [Pseudodesulfovibrio profundus]|uniref:Uncharacterized protein n=1 Tax=Pseudodesulfovibrio profundus TaxID=57320 RepID=A0A2C8F678_9BACT|nr:protein of unknown function [Pseudodesulfovibrio profundus]